MSPQKAIEKQGLHVGRIHYVRKNGFSGKNPLSSDWQTFITTLEAVGGKKCISHISCNFLALKYLCSPLPELGNDAAGVDEAFTGDGFKKTTFSL